MREKGYTGMLTLEGVDKEYPHSDSSQNPDWRMGFIDAKGDNEVFGEAHEEE